MRPPCRGPRSSAAAAPRAHSLSARVPNDQRHRLRPEASGHECDHLRGGAIEPLLVIDHAEQRLLGGRLREQAQHGEADQEPVGNRPGIKAEASERIALRGRRAASRSSSGANS